MVLEDYDMRTSILSMLLIMQRQLYVIPCCWLRRKTFLRLVLTCELKAEWFIFDHVLTLVPY
jgi:hypothetical protein